MRAKKTASKLVLWISAVICCFALMNPSFGADRGVAQVQRELKILGYYEGQIDGIWGRRSTVALDRFARDVGIWLDFNVLYDPSYFSEYEREILRDMAATARYKPRPKPYKDRFPSWCFSGRVSTYNEQLICSSGSLGELDKELGETWRRATRKYGKRYVENAIGSIPQYVRYRDEYCGNDVYYGRSGFLDRLECLYDIEKQRLHQVIDLLN